MEKVFIAIDLVARLKKLIKQAIATGRDITDEELTTFYDEAKQSHENWRNRQ